MVNSSSIDIPTIRIWWLVVDLAVLDSNLHRLSVNNFVLLYVTIIVFTGRLLAQMANNESIDIDLNAFSVNRKVIVESKL